MNIEMDKSPVINAKKDMDRGSTDTLFAEHSGLKILSWGRDIKSLSKGQQPRSFNYYSLCQFNGGDGFYLDENISIPSIETGSFVLQTPGNVHQYGCRTSYWREDFITFSGSYADYLCSQGLLASGLYKATTIRRLPEIIEMSEKPDVYSQLYASHLLQKLLLELVWNIQEDDNTNPVLANLIQNIQQNPRRWWTVKELAEDCGYSISQFRHLFLQHTGLSPKVYIDKVKISAAAEYLLRTSTSIKKTAERFAYQDPYHFSRRFKNVMGISPKNYRNQYLNK